MHISESNSIKLDQSQDKDIKSVPRWKQNGDAILYLVKEWVHCPIEATPLFWEVAESLTF